MKFHIHNLKFRNQIIFVFLIIFLLVGVGSGVAFYSISARQVTDNFSKSSKDAIGQIHSTLETRLGIIDEKAASMLINGSFTAVMSQYLNQPTIANTVKTQGNVSDYLKDFERGEALINSSLLVTSQMAFDSYVRYRKQDFDFQGSPFYTVYQDPTVKSVQWFGMMDNLIFQSEGKVIPCVRRFGVSEYQGWLYFIYQLDHRELKKLVVGKESFFDDIMIIDEKGNLILGKKTVSPETLLAAWDEETGTVRKDGGSGIVLEDGMEYLAEGCSLSQNGWKVFGLKSRQELLRSLKQLQRDILKVILLLFTASMALIILIAKHLTDALNRLERQMICARNGDFSVRFFYPYKDEIGSLSQCFNYMIEEIQSLIRKQEQSIIDLRIERDHVAEVQKQKRKAELKALQAQINPHFLYNTLNAITWQAADKGMGDVSLMASSLGKFFRLTLSKGAEIIPLADEVDHVQSYLSIQGIRYQDKLNYEIAVPKQVLDCQVLKLILQPLVENAIYHGIKEKRGKGVIRITAEESACRQTAKIRLIVWDDGAGIPKEKLTVINQSLKCGVNSTGEGYGIYNVNERIRLYYGSEYGLTYESEAGSFTKAVLTIPAQRQEVE